MEMELVSTFNESPPWIHFNSDENNKCELCENGTSIKINNNKEVWILDTITRKWSIGN